MRDFMLSVDVYAQQGAPAERPTAIWFRVG